MTGAALPTTTVSSRNQLRSFLTWVFALSVLSLIIGFPLVILGVTIASLAIVVLHAILPVSSVLVVSGGILGALVAGIFGTAALLTARGVHPQDVSWLTWLNGNSEIKVDRNYAACPLTCDMK